MKKENKKNKVFVAMSGGVDSSVSAALLKRAGFDVVGIYMRQWSPKVLGKECIWKQDRQDAMRVCAKLSIPFLTWDFSKEYEKYVGKYMIDSYKKGITPNPDVACNKIIKFGFFFDKAMEEGADFIATGHYARNSLGKQDSSAWLQSSANARGPAAARSIRGNFPASRDHAKLPARYASDLQPRLLKAKDQNKDQTYFLYELKPEQLAKTIFPVGNLQKPEVRKLAKKFGLDVAEKKDSQGVCFIGPLNMKNFLEKYIKPRRGNILLWRPSTGSGCSDKIGTHDGAWYYTIGQRHGLDIKEGHGPYFLVKKDIKKNIIWVGRERDLYSKKAKVKNINWIEKPKSFPALVDVRTRYRAPLVKALLKKDGTVIFRKGERAVTSGQSAVFYKGNAVLGGGIIE